MIPFSFIFRPIRLLLLLATTLTLASCEIEVIHQWNVLGFDLPFDYPVQGGYIPENNVFTGLEIGWNRIFLAVPRLRAGIPATLAWIPRKSSEGSSPLLQVS